MKMGGIRNANRILKDLSVYTSKVVYNKEHVYYLNQSGHKLFGEGKLYIMVKLHMLFYVMKLGYIYIVQMIGK